MSSLTAPAADRDKLSGRPGAVQTAIVPYLHGLLSVNGCDFNRSRCERRHLRNKFAEVDPQIQEMGHRVFRFSLDEAITHLAKRSGVLRYADFLAVHRILFEGFHPWAGQDPAVMA